MSVLNDLESLSSAEEFFEYLGVEYDPAVVRVARLHIMRRMGQYLRGDEVEGLTADEASLFAMCQANLAQAYADFVASSPIDERVFKVHQEAMVPKAAPAKPFVPLSAIMGE